MDSSLATRRLVCTGLWSITLVAAVAGLWIDDGGLMMFSWLMAITMLFVTLGVAKPRSEEHLVRPLIYRSLAGAMLGVALAGGGLALVPEASDTSQAFGVFFGLVALLAYRAVVARGPRAAMLAIGVAAVAWVPFVLVTLVGCKCGKSIQAPHWTAEASELAMQIFLFGLPVLASVALLAFAPRRVPEARVLQQHEQRRDPGEHDHDSADPRE